MVGDIQVVRGAKPKTKFIPDCPELRIRRNTPDILMPEEVFCDGRINVGIDAFGMSFGI